MANKHLTRPEVMDLDLFDDLRAHLDAKRAALAKQVVGRGRDKKRMFTGKIRAVIYTRDGGVCWYCKASVAPSRTQIDHVIPWSRGGRTNAHNGVVSCGPCNRTKSAKVW